MDLLLRRVYLASTYTIGKLYIDGKYFCDVLEDPVRDFNKNGKFDNGEKKIYGETAIPYGTYLVTLDIVSSRFRNSSWAKPYNGKVPRLLNVPEFQGVLIHPGNTAKDTHGCLLLGENKVKGKVINSVNTFHKFMDKIKGLKNLKITIL